MEAFVNSMCLRLGQDLYGALVPSVSRGRRVHVLGRPPSCQRFLFVCLLSGSLVRLHAPPRTGTALAYWRRTHAQLLRSQPRSAREKLGEAQRGTIAIDLGESAASGASSPRRRWRHLLRRGRAGDHRGDGRVRQQPGEGELEQACGRAIRRRRSAPRRLQVRVVEAGRRSARRLEPGARGRWPARAGICRSAGRWRAGSRAGRRGPAARIRRGLRRSGSRWSRL